MTIYLFNMIQSLAY